MAMASTTGVLSVKLNENSKCALMTCNKKVAKGVICALCNVVYHSKCATSAGNTNPDERLTFWSCVKCIPNPDAARKLADILHMTTSLSRENAIYVKLVNQLEEKIEYLQGKVNKIATSEGSKNSIAKTTNQVKTVNNHIDRETKEVTASTNIRDEPFIPDHQKINGNDKRRSGERRLRNQKGIYGTAKIEENTGENVEGNKSTQTSFAAVTRRAWLYVGRATKNSTAEGLRNYLVSKCPNQDFRVEKLDSREEAQTLSFKVGFDYDLLDKLNDSNFWPSGLLVRRFNFFRKMPKTQELT